MATKGLQKKDNLPEKSNRLSLSSEQMGEYCRRIVSYLELEKRYRTSDYSLWDLSRDTGIPVKTI